MKCKLPPFKIEPVLSILDIKQRMSWGITAFNLPDIWKKSKGEGVNIAVLDTGADLDHEDLKNNLLQGINLVNPKKDPIDKLGHATHCCGIIAAENNGIGVVGVAPKSKIIPVKVLDDGGDGTMDNVAKGIIWATENKADMICMSLGSPNPISQVRIAIQKATAKGIPVFCAAGNSNLKKLFYPSQYPETISISSIDKDFNKSKFSNISKNLNFFAPGQDILSTIPDNQYGVMSGTSMSAPWVCGVAALLLSYSRNNKTKLTLRCSEDYINILKQHSCPVKESSFQGLGVIDPRHFIEWINNT